MEGGGTCPSVTVQNIDLVAGPFNNIPASFNENLCMGFGQGTSLFSDVSWTVLFQDGYTIFIEVETIDDCSNPWKEQTRYCVATPGGLVVSSRTTNGGSPTNPGSPVAYGERLQSRLPSNREYRVTVYVYTRCDFCNNSSSSSRYQYIFLATAVVQPGELNPDSSLDLGSFVYFSKSVCSQTCN